MRKVLLLLCMMCLMAFKLAREPEGDPVIFLENNYIRPGDFHVLSESRLIHDYI